MSDESIAEESKTVVRQYFELLNSVPEHPVAMCTEDFTFTVFGSPTIGLQQCIEFTKDFFAAIPDLKHPLDELIAEGGTVAFRYGYLGTHTGEVFGAVPTGNKIDYQGIGWMRVRNGKVAEFIVSPDRVTFMQQLGLLPANS
jgi:predicted ester cyclase